MKDKAPKHDEGSLHIESSTRVGGNAPLVTHDGRPVWEQRETYGKVGKETGHLFFNYPILEHHILTHDYAQVSLVSSATNMSPSVPHSQLWEVLCSVTTKASFLSHS